MVAQDVESAGEKQQQRHFLLHLGQRWGKQSVTHLFTAHKLPLILLYYALCSSTLIVINKVAVHNVKAPVFILALQLLFAAYTVKFLTVCGVVEAESLQWKLVKPFLLIVMSFLGVVTSNIQVLVHSNVETFITFRSITPFVLAVLEWLFLGRTLPGSRSIFSIILMIASCAGYTYFDQGFKLEAYTWLLIWYAFVSFDACYVRYHCDNVQMTNWGRVYYTNMLSGLVLACVFPFARSEHAVLRSMHFSSGQLLLLFVSCLVGTCMSHASYLLRSHVSATTGVVVGLVCKLLSVVINCLIWDQHATPVQLGFLLVGVLGGAMFEQQPMRSKAAASKLPLASQEPAEEFHEDKTKL